MVNEIYANGLNKGVGSKFCVSSWVQHEMPEDEDEDNISRFISEI